MCLTKNEQNSRLFGVDSSKHDDISKELAFVLLKSADKTTDDLKPPRLPRSNVLLCMGILYTSTYIVSKHFHLVRNSRLFMQSNTLRNT